MSWRNGHASICFLTARIAMIWYQPFFCQEWAWAANTFSIWVFNKQAHWLLLQASKLCLSTNPRLIFQSTCLNLQLVQNLNEILYLLINYLFICCCTLPRAGTFVHVSSKHEYTGMTSRPHFHFLKTKHVFAKKD